MDVTAESNGIIKYLKRKYPKYIKSKCIDINNIINICEMNNAPDDADTVELDEIEFSSPDFASQAKYDEQAIKTTEFKKRCVLFTKLLYACIKIGTRIIEKTDGIAILKNNYKLCSSLRKTRRNIIAEHIQELTYYSNNPKVEMGEMYPEYLKEFNAKIYIVDKITRTIESLVKDKVLKNSDTLLTLILPYFFIYIKYIEEYNQSD